jgi:hypothetical protein
MQILAAILALIFVIVTAIKTWTFFLDPQVRHLHSAMIFFLIALFFLIASTLRGRKTNA